MSDNLRKGKDPLTPEQREDMIEMARQIALAIQNNHIHVVENTLLDGTPVLTWCLMVEHGTGTIIGPNNKAEMVGQQADVYPLCIFGRDVMNTMDIITPPEGVVIDEKHTVN